MSKIIIYQTLPRLFGNDCRTCVPHGGIGRNGSGKFNDFTPEALADIRDLGATHVWFTGVIAHASATGYPAEGIAPAPPSVLKGLAGSPYAIRDYYDVDPDLAVNPVCRMQEFEALVSRTHEAGMRVIIDFVPNHVSRVYHGTMRPEGTEDLGASDRPGLAFHPSNNFYYMPDEAFRSPAPDGDGPVYTEMPARATGNDCFKAAPDAADWYETVKLNYGVDYLQGGRTAFCPVPDTWHKMLHILKFWASKGIDGFRCDMAEMVPAAFWHWAVASVKEAFPDIIFIGEVYQPALYRTYLDEGGFDYLYDKVGLYDTLRDVMTLRRPASDLTTAWQAVEGMQDRMLSFLENHDEQRIASDFFAGRPQPGRAALAVAVLQRGNPFMLYAGQELGEPGMQQEGFSQCDGRTSIFDYAAIPCLQAWRHRNDPGWERPTEAQLRLRRDYQRTLRAARCHAAQEGFFYDLMYAAPEGFDRTRQYAFLRYAGGDMMLVVANFAPCDVSVPVQIPLHAFEFLHMDRDMTVWCTDQLSDRRCRLTFSPDFPCRIEVPAEGAVALTCTLRRPPSDCTLPRDAGTAVPVFSLRSAADWGIGDFLDLKLLADWAAATGQRWIQTLPVNDTTRTHTWRDSYPYNSVSAFALHPLYIRPDAIGPLTEPLTSGEQALLMRSSHSADPLDYEAVDALKWRVFRLLYRQYGRQTLASPAYREFYESNRFWLEPYAAFCLLRDRYGSAAFRQWPAFSVFDPVAVADLLSEHAAEAGLYSFLQFHAASQLREAHEYARRLGVRFKGDIPIGVSRDGADIWQHPELFDDTMQAGAPPDDFSTDGQNWGFPLYRWDVMAADRYRWWCLRLQNMAAFFDAYRLDHILGFFRIFAIPETQISGLLGVFRPALPLSADDFASWGLAFDEQRFTMPFCDLPWLRTQFTEEELPHVMQHFLQPMDGENVYTLRTPFLSQRAVAAYFDATRDRWLAAHPDLCRRVQSLCCEVLLVRDVLSGGYHPRIQLWTSRSFQALEEELRKRFMALYHHFYQERHNEFWKEEALRKLPVLLGATQMLACGEDLGMIPDSVPDVMQQLHVLSLEIFRMPKVPQIPFGILKNYPYESVCTTSSHDTSTLRGWWEECRDEACRYYHQALREEGDVPFFCEPWICERILAMHLQAPSRLVIFPLQDWMSVDGAVRWDNTQGERINVPADAQHYWRYRMHIPLETLGMAKNLNDRIRQLVQLRLMPV